MLKRFSIAALLLVAALFAFRPVGQTQEKKDQKGALGLLDPSAFLYGHADFSAVYAAKPVLKAMKSLKLFDQLFADIVKEDGHDARNFEAVGFSLASPNIFTDGPNQLGASIYFVMKGLKPWDASAIRKAKARFGKGSDDPNVLFETDRETTFLSDPKTLIDGTPDTYRLFKARNLPPQAKGPLAPTFAEAAKHHGFLACDLSRLPDQFKAMIPEPLTALKNAKLATASLDISDTVLLRFAVHCADAKDAAALEGVMPQLLDEGRAALKGMIEMIPAKERELNAEALKAFQVAATAANATRDGAVVTLKIELATDWMTDAYLSKVNAWTLAASGLAKESNNLKQIGLSFHNFESANGRCPTAAIYDKNEKPLLSWRVAILPYIEQEELYKQFKLNEPWDSENNKKLIAKMPELFLLNDQKNEGKTHLRVFTGNGAAFEVFKGFSIAALPDGASNTLLVAPHAESVEWTKPDEPKFDPKGDMKKLLLFRDGKLVAAFADGSVRQLKESLDGKTINNAIQANDGNVIDLDK